MKSPRRAGLAFAISLVPILAPAAAHAHGVGGEFSGFLHGFIHPVTGIDHVLAMVAVGLLAAALGGRARLAVPAAFVATMILGGVLGMQGVGLPAVEAVIALSVVVLGAVLALGVAMPVAGAMGLVAAFALFHGHAHGTEVPAHASGLAFAIGFVIATALLHAVGLGIGLSASAVSPRQARLVLRFAGGGMALAGAGLLAALI